jgi:hypothetical protein
MPSGGPVRPAAPRRSTARSSVARNEAPRGPACHDEATFERASTLESREPETRSSENVRRTQSFHQRYVERAPGRGEPLAAPGRSNARGAWMTTAPAGGLPMSRHGRSDGSTHEISGSLVPHRRARLPTSATRTRRSAHGDPSAGVLLDRSPRRSSRRRASRARPLPTLGLYPRRLFR